MSTGEWLPVVTLIIGLIVAFGFDSVRDRRQRQAQREQESRQWQREKAYDLLLALNDLYQSTMTLREHFMVGDDEETNLVNTDTYRATNAAFSVALNLCHTLRALLADEQLADAIGKAIPPYVRAAMPPDAHTYDTTLAPAVETHNEITRRIGAYARSL